MKRAEIERRIREMPWPAPTDALRLRVLSTARPGVTPLTWSDRIWYSQRWRRVALAATMSGLVLAAWPRSDVEDFDASPRLVADAHAIAETAREIGLPEDLAASLATRAQRRHGQPEAYGQRTLALQTIERSVQR